MTTCMTSSSEISMAYACVHDKPITHNEHKIFQSLSHDINEIYEKSPQRKINIIIYRYLFCYPVYIARDIIASITVGASVDMQQFTEMSRSGSGHLGNLIASGRSWKSWK